MELGLEYGKLGRLFPRHGRVGTKAQKKHKTDPQALEWLNSNDHKDLDDVRKLFESADQDHLYYQIEQLRPKVNGESKSAVHSAEHFVFRFVRSFWGRLFPKQFLLYLELNKEAGIVENFAISFKDAKIQASFTPDFSNLSQLLERNPTLAEKNKFLYDRYLMKSYSLSIASGVWSSLLKHPRPLRLMLKTIHLIRFRNRDSSNQVTSISGFNRLQKVILLFAAFFRKS